MYHGSNRAGIREYFMTFARMWMQFVTTKTDKGRGKKPRLVLNNIYVILNSSIARYSFFGKMVFKYFQLIRKYYLWFLKIFFYEKPSKFYLPCYC